MTLPFDPPVAPMLAKLTSDIPRGDDWLYEPKWDGFRAIIWRGRDETTIISRDGRPFNRYFPELIPAFEVAFPKPCVVDGEIVIAGDRSLEFDSMLLRIHPAASRVKMLSEQTPSSFVAFDILAEGKKDLRNTPLEERRARLEAAADAGQIPGDATREHVLDTLRPAPKVALTPHTQDADLAASWFEIYEGAGLDGVIAKRKDLLYLPGDRAMAKIKHQRTADCVVGGYRLAKSGDGIGSLLLGLYDDSKTLHYVGHTSSFKAERRKELLEELQPLVGGESFGGGRSPGGPSRWAAAAEKTWVSLEPKLVCEVSFDYLQGERFRHAARFLRWRDDKQPKSCTFEQILPPE